MKKRKRKGGLIDFSSPSAHAFKIKIEKHIKDFVKSVQTERLLSFLDDELQYVVLGVLYMENKEGDAPAVKVSKSMSNSEKIARWIGSYYYVFDYLSRFLFLVIPRMFKGYVIIYDRYVYDLYIMPGASKYAAWLIERLAPRPQIVCFLDVNAEAIISRRAERTMEEAKHQQIILGNVAQRVAKGRIFVNVPGSVDAKTSAKQITRICIMQALRKQIKNKKIISMLIKDAKSRLEEK